MAVFQKSAELEAIANEIIDIYPEDFSGLGNCRIAYQTSDISKKSYGKVVYADTEKIRDKHKALMNYDFVITFYADGVAVSKDIKRKLMYHELLHVGYDPESEKCSIIPHDLEDFKAVIEKWGTDWIFDNQ